MQPDHPSARKAALVVDDDPILREVMTTRLAEAGFSVIGVEDGEEACQRLACQQFALALVDLNMPKLNGFDLLRHIRRDPRTVDLPVIVVTASGDKLSIEEAYSLGASSFLTKPVNWSQFLHHVRFVARSGEIEQALRRAQAEAEAASRMKTGLFHMLSHELRTPISTLVGFAGLLSASPAQAQDPDQCDHLNHIVEAAQRLNALIGDILLYSKTLASPATAGFVDYPAAELIDDALTGMKSKAKQKRITLATSISANDLTLPCDPKLLRRAISKLVDNAIKFSEPGSTVEIAAHRRNGSAVISVKDSGPGMNTDKLAECLQPFIQADMSWGRPAEGLGLGLPIARFIAEAHGGELVCTTAPGKGMTAALTLPSAKVKSGQARAG